MHSTKRGTLAVLVLAILSLWTPAAAQASTAQGSTAQGSKGAGTSPTNGPSGSKAPASLKVGVVDLAKILDSYQRAIDGKKRIDALKSEFQAQFDDMQKRAEDAKLLRDNYRVGSKEWYEKDLTVKVSLQMLDGRRQIFENELRKQREVFLSEMFDDMQQAVGIVAKEQGISIVIRTHEDVLDGSPEVKSHLFETRVVWFASEEVDMTPDVIRLLRVPLPPREKADAKAPQNGNSTDSSSGNPEPGK